MRTHAVNPHELVSASRGGRGPTSAERVRRAYALNESLLDTPRGGGQGGRQRPLPEPAGRLGDR